MKDTKSALFESVLKEHEAENYDSAIEQANRMYISLARRVGPNVAKMAFRVVAES